MGESNEVKIIVYGTLMRGESNHHFCQNAISIIPCTIHGQLFDTGYGYPAFVPDGVMSVAAELITLPIEDWSRIDSLEGYPYLYNRKEIEATLNDGTSVTGWVYIMNNLPPYATKISSGSWKNRDY